ncbi:MAG: MAPEG family protein [Hyphomicrobiales bacterium]|nr:MAPEG family protein [Alphaproteobacteria bacterium]
MSKELYWLVLTSAMTGLLWVPYILDRIMVRGPIGATANPSPADKPQSAWAQRMMAAHANTVENLVVFAPLALAAHALNIHTGTTAFACAMFFWCRLVYVAVYTAGIPMLRTLAFAGGWIAQMILVLAVLGMM